MDAILPRSPAWILRASSTKGGAPAYLEADIDAHLPIDVLCDLKRLPCLCDVDADWFFGSRRACLHSRRFEMLYVEEGRRRDLYGVDLFAVCQLFKCVMAAKEKSGVDAWVIRSEATLSKCSLPFAN